MNTTYQENVMSFNASVLSEKTVKSFVDRLLRRYKTHTNPAMHSIKRASAQEDVAAMLGFASWHALSSQLRPLSVAPASCTGLIASSRLQQMSDFNKSMPLQRTNGIEFLEWNLLRHHFFVQGSDHARSQWHQELLTTNPQQTVLFVQGPLSHRLPWNGLVLHNHAITSQALFLCHSAAEITEFLVGLMDDAGRDNAIWRGRAISLISCVVLALVHLRDHDGLPMDAHVIRDHLGLEKMQQLSKRHDLPPHILQSLKAYLRSLPGYQENAPRQSETVIDLHGYSGMQFTRVLSLLDEKSKNALAQTHLKLSFDAQTDVAHSVMQFVKAWACAHPKSLIVFDGLEHTSPLYHFVLHTLSLLHDNEVALAIGSASDADLPDDANAQKRLVSRINGQIDVHL